MKKLSPHNDVLENGEAQPSSSVLFLTLSLYVFLSIGSLLPTNLPEIVQVIIPAFAVLLLIILAKSQKFLNEAYYTTIWIAPIAAIFLVSTFRTTQPEYAIFKLDGAVITPILTAALARYLIRNYGIQVFLLSFVKIAFVILVITVFYKFLFGFWARDVRFFLNGPIVFGWMMAVSSIISLYLFYTKKNAKYAILCGIFSVAVLWTLSKGPLLSLCLSALYVSTRVGRPILVLKLVVFGSAILYLFLNYIPSEYLSRLEAFTRLVSGELKEVDSGSIGTRQEMITATIALIKENIFFGVGLGNWDQRVSSSIGTYQYPHNIYLEILSEIGLIGAILVGIIFFIMFIRSPVIGQGVVLVFAVGSAVSGDLAYMRLILTFLLAFSVVGARIGAK